MFNVIMGPCDWNKGQGYILVERLFEYTDDDICAQFKEKGAPDLNRLAQYPCLFMNEGMGEEPAYVGRIDNPRIQGQKILFECILDAGSPPLQNSALYDIRSALTMKADIEFHRQHWDVKNIDLYKTLFFNLTLCRQNPTVFKLPRYENINHRFVSVMMPFSDDFDSVYKKIQHAAKNLNLACKRADDFWYDDKIIQDVITLIDRAKIVVRDCTGRNPNVFYEAGIAHTLGRNVIFITQNKDDIPFDVSSIRYIEYQNTDEGLAKLTKDLQARMETLLHS